MPKKCFVPTCNSGYKTCKEKVSLFSVPGCQGLLEKWQSAIGREDRVMSKKDHICEKHFKDDDVIRYWYYKEIQDKLKTPRLKKDAVPCIFPSKPSLDKVKPKKPKRQKKPEKLKKPEILNKPKKPPEEEIDEETNNNELVLVDEEDYEVLNFFNESELFNKLWNDEVTLTFPSASWSLHKVQDTTSRTLVISDTVVTNCVPCYHKQIIMGDCETLSIFVGSNIVSIKDQVKYFGNAVVLDTLEDLNTLVNSLHSINVSLDEFLLGTELCDII